MGWGATVSRIVAKRFWSEDVRVAPKRVKGGDALMSQWDALVRSELGNALVDELVQMMRTVPAARAEVWDQARRSWWVLRNKHLSGDEAVRDAVFDLMVVDVVMQTAGVDREMWRRMNACASEGCVCDGCDLYNAARLVQSHLGPPSRPVLVQSPSADSVGPSRGR